MGTKALLLFYDQVLEALIKDFRLSFIIDHLAPCSQPVGLKVSATTDESVEVSWQLPTEIGAAGLDAYKVCICLTW